MKIKNQGQKLKVPLISATDLAMLKLLIFKNRMRLLIFFADFLIVEYMSPMFEICSEFAMISMGVAIERQPLSIAQFYKVQCQAFYTIMIPYLGTFKLYEYNLLLKV